MILLLPYASDLFAQKMVRKYIGSTAKAIPGTQPIISNGSNDLNPLAEKKKFEIDIENMAPTNANTTLSKLIDKRRVGKEPIGKTLLRMIRQRSTETEYSSFSAPNALIVYFSPKDKP